jgi:hypothetical protein
VEVVADLSAVLAQKDIVGFLHGLHTAMIVGAALAFLGALLGLLVQRGATAEAAAVGVSG